MVAIVRWLIGQLWKLADAGSTWEYILDLIGLKTVLWAAVGAVVTLATVVWQGAPPWAITLSVLFALLLVFSGSAIWQVRHLRAPRVKRNDPKAGASNAASEAAGRKLLEAAGVLVRWDENAVEKIAHKIGYIAKFRLGSEGMYANLNIASFSQEIDEHFAAVVAKANDLIEPLRVDLPDAVLDPCDAIIAFHKRKRDEMPYRQILRDFHSRKLVTESAGLEALRRENDKWDAEREKLVRAITNALRQSRAN